jgi:nucleotide-binding universal stress UspA family protein
MLQRILVPLDGSEFAETVLPYVKEIGRRCEPVEVILLEVVRLPQGRAATLFRPQDIEYREPLPDSEADVEAAQHPIYREQEIASARAAAEAELRPLAQKLRDENTSVRVEVAFGRPADEIITFADSENVDLIAMCTHGRSGLGRWILGGVADKVLRGTHRPVFLVRPPGMTGAG